MPITSLSRAWLVALGCCGVVAHAASPSASYPTKPVRVIVPLAPGGGSDIVARMVAQGLSELWAKPVIVDNRPGAGSAVGTSIAAKAASDGYTLLVSSSSIAISPALYRNLDFDIVRDFSGITLLASQPSMLVVHPSVAAASVKELIALAKTQKLSYGSAGVGSATHLGTELLLYTAKMPMLHVPYKSAGQATRALLGGETQVLLTNMASVAPHVSAGRLKALGISSKKRSPVAPQVPTLQESGLPGFEYATWYAMLAPASTNAALIEQRPEGTWSRKAPRVTRPGGARLDARRVRPLSEGGDRALGERGQSGKHQRRITMPACGACRRVHVRRTPMSIDCRGSLRPAAAVGATHRRRRSRPEWLHCPRG